MCDQVVYALICWGPHVASCAVEKFLQTAILDFIACGGVYDSIWFHDSASRCQVRGTPVMRLDEGFG